MDYSKAKITANQQIHFDVIDNNNCIITSNEDLQFAYYMLGKKRIKISYSFYLKLWYRGVLQLLDSDIDNCVFKYSLIHQ